MDENKPKLVKIPTTKRKRLFVLRFPGVVHVNVAKALQDEAERRLKSAGVDAEVLLLPEGATLEEIGAVSYGVDIDTTTYDEPFYRSIRQAFGGDHFDATTIEGNDW